MQCNIDARGRAVRLAWGVLMLLAGLVLGGLAAFGVLAAWWWWLVAAGLAAFGALGIYEARAGWCVVRAMGFRTPV